MYIDGWTLAIFLVTFFVLLAFGIMLVPYFLKKRSFPKKLLLTAVTGIALGFGLIGYHTYFFTFGDLEGTPYEETTKSPQGTYTANAYYETYGGAAGGVNLWVEITNHEQDNEKEVIYYSDAKSHFSLEWKDDQTLSITNEEPRSPESNQSIDLEVGKEIYHDRGFACQSFLMKDRYEECYEG